MKPAGSMRRTRASSGALPPQCSITAASPGCDFHGVGRQDINPDFEVRGIADLEKLGAGLDDRRHFPG